MEIPAYKFRGESALLECVYELNGGGGGSVVVHPRTRGQHHGARYRQPLEYISQQQQQQPHHEESGEGEDDDEGVVEEEFKYAKRKRKKYARYRKYGDSDMEGDGGDPEGHAAEAEEEEEGELGEETDNHEDLGERIPHYPVSSLATNDGFPETLYSVKWYKDNEEFYRYVPKASPPQNSYKVEGIRVDVSRLVWVLFQAKFSLSLSTKNG